MPRLTLSELPAPPADRTGWPWTEASDAPADPGVGPGPRISIVTPSFNQAPFIEETIRSVLLQGYDDLEYFVVDGGSTDGSVDVIRKYERFLDHWVSEPDRGQSHALNKGFARATGEVLTWLNSDDAYRPGVLHKAAAEFRRNPAAVLIYGRAADRDEHGVPLDRFKGFAFTLEGLIAGVNPVAQPSAFFRKTAFDNVGPVDESLHYSMDHDLWLRLGAAGEVVFVDEIWSDFRQYMGSKSGTAWLPFLIDIDRLLHRAFRETWLPRRLLSSRRAALGRSLLNVAIECHWVERDGEARSHALRALLQCPRLLADAGARLDLMRCLAGTRWSRRLKPFRRLMRPRADP